jgi:hypothetical protein
VLRNIMHTVVGHGLMAAPIPKGRRLPSTRGRRLPSWLVMMPRLQDVLPP